MKKFSDAIEGLKLIDPLLLGGKYTWIRGDNHEGYSQIDRFMYSAEWEIISTSKDHI